MRNNRSYLSNSEIYHVGEVNKDYASEAHLFGAGTGDGDVHVAAEGGLT